MNVVQLKEELYNNPEYIIKILEYLDCGKIKYFKGNNEVRSAIDENPKSNANSLRINVETCYVTSFSDRLNFKGDIVALVQEYKKCNLNTAIKIICDILGFKYSGYNPSSMSKGQIPFGGYWEEIDIGSVDVDLETYPDSILNGYRDVGNQRFMNDGINLITQKEFNIMYDCASLRIVVPWRNPQGEIIGIMGRMDFDTEECEEMGTSKWLPLLPFQKSKVLYGYSENYKSIQKNRTVIITESEKGVMQLHSMGIYSGVAVGSHSISDIQKNYIETLMPNNIIIAFDEDVKEDWLQEQAHLFKSNLGFDELKVSYIKDKNNIYLPKNSKMAPTDKGRATFQNLVRDCLVTI